MSASARDDVTARAERRLLAGEPLSAEEAGALASSPEARRRVAEQDPSALFALLGPLKVDPPAPAQPRLASGRERRRGRIARLAGAAAAASLLAAAAMVVAVRAPETGAGRVEALAGRASPVVGAAEARFRSGDAVTEVVRRLDSRTARVVTVVPQSAEDPTVTVILDEEIDL